MAELEQVERLRERANVSFAEAKEALDAADGDLLDALIYLERQGKVIPPAGGGSYQSGGTAQEQTVPPVQQEPKYTGDSFGALLKRFFKFCGRAINRGNNNFLDVIRGGETVMSCPVTAFVVLFIFFFWAIVPAMIISLFCGVSYHFRGAELGRESVNRVMDSATEAAEDIKKSFHGNK